MFCQSKHLQCCLCTVYGVDFEIDVDWAPIWVWNLVSKLNFKFWSIWSADLDVKVWRWLPRLILPFNISQYGHESNLNSEKQGLLIISYRVIKWDCELCYHSETKGVTQPFIESFHIEVLVFWCLNGDTWRRNN